MSGLDEVRQRREDLFLRIAAESRERWYYGRPLGWRSLSERYVELGDALHVHVVAGVGSVNPVSRKLCFAFHRWPSSQPLEALDVETLAGTADAHAHNREQGDLNAPVFVQVPKLVKDPEVIGGEGIPSLVRLQVLDDCLSVGMERPWPDPLIGPPPMRVV